MRSQPSVVAGSQADVGAVIGENDVIAAHLRGKRQLAQTVLAFAIQVVIRVDRHQILVLSRVAGTPGSGQVRVLVGIAPRIELAAGANRGQARGRHLEIIHVQARARVEHRDVGDRARNIHAIAVVRVRGQRDRRDDAEDRNDEQQLDDGETAMAVIAGMHPCPRRQTYDTRPALSPESVTATPGRSLLYQRNQSHTAWPRRERGGGYLAWSTPRCASVALVFAEVRNAVNALAATGVFAFVVRPAKYGS